MSVKNKKQQTKILKTQQTILKIQKKHFEESWKIGFKKTIKSIWKTTIKRKWNAKKVIKNKKRFYNNLKNND